VVTSENVWGLDETSFSRTHIRQHDRRRADLRREVVVLSLARLQLADLAEPVLAPGPDDERSWKAKS
jgi:hypothetical protein